MTTVRNIRKLKTKDLFRVASILSKMSKSAVNELKQETSEQQFGFIFIQSALAHAESEVKEWLSDMVGMTVEEFDDLPFDATLDIIELLEKENDLNSFFDRVKTLMKTFKVKS